MSLIGTLVQFFSGTVASAADVNQNFTDIRNAFNNSAVLTDVARDITVSHTFNNNQGLKGKRADGAVRNLLKLNAQDKLEMGQAGLPMVLHGLFSGFRAYRSGSAQALAHNTQAKVLLNAETFDDLGYWDPTTNHQGVPPAGLGGKYLFVGSVSWTSGPEAERSLMLVVQGAVVAKKTDVAAGEFSQQILTVAHWNAGETLELHAIQSSGGSLSINDSAPSTFLAAYYLGDF